MTIRTPAIVAVLAALSLTGENRLSAQPIAPPRAPNNAFGSFFGGGSALMPNAGFGYNGTVNNIPRAGTLNPYGTGVGNLGPFGGSPYYGPYTPFILNRQPVVFNNRGHWYANYLGHWYPNGWTNGAGVLTNGGTGGGAYRLPGMGMGGLGGTGGAILPGAGGSAPGVGGMPNAGGAVPGIIAPGAIK